MALAVSTPAFASPARHPVSLLGGVSFSDPTVSHVPSSAYDAYQAALVVISDTFAHDVNLANTTYRAAVSPVPKSSPVYRIALETLHSELATAALTYQAALVAPNATASSRDLALVTYLTSVHAAHATFDTTTHAKITASTFIKARAALALAIDAAATKRAVAIAALGPAPAKPVKTHPDH